MSAMNEMSYRCIGGGLAGNDGVCVEHGETACVIGVRIRVPSPQDFYADRAPEREGARETASASMSRQY
jgi:hypothetical protein